MAALFLPCTLLACTLAEDDEEYSFAQLAAARAAIPPAARLESGVPTPSNNPGALSLDADSETAALAIAAATEINQPVADMIAILETIVALPPTLYDSSTRQFVWGPWDNDEGVGQVLAYIRENAPDDDFAYAYAFARTMDGDVTQAVPVIWGAATPDTENPDYGVGVTLWDIDANNAFDDAHDPSAVAGPEQGKVVMLYGHGEADGAEILYNLAVLRNFRGDDGEPSEGPVDSDYFYGRATSEGGALVFLDWEFDYDVCDADSSCWEDQTVADADERFSLRAAFVGTAGRGEATVSDGDLSAPIELVECWDSQLTTTYVSVDTGTESVSDGTCGWGESVSLADSGVPTLADVDAELMDALICVAENGVEACEE
jgi:hypothetical protein